MISALLEAVGQSVIVTASKVGCAKRVESIEAEMLKLPQVECPVTHHFAPGVCIREVFMPAGSIVIGHAHRFPDLNIMLKGSVTLLCEDGSIKMLHAPLTFLGCSGRKIAYIHEDCIWQNVFPTNETDTEKVENIFLEKSQVFQESSRIRMLLDSLKCKVDREDYLIAMEECGISLSNARGISECLTDQMDMPVECGCKVSDSPIEGKGFFATRNYESNETICPARIGDKRTPAGRFINHSRRPNAKMVYFQDEDAIMVVAIRSISGCRGGQNGDEITVDYRQALSVTSDVNKRKALCQQ